MAKSILVALLILFVAAPVWAQSGMPRLDPDLERPKKKTGPARGDKEILHDPDYSADQDLVFDPTKPTQREKEAKRTVRKNIRDDYRDEQEAMYKQLKTDRRELEKEMAQKREELLEEIEKKYRQKKEALKEKQQAELDAAETAKEKREIKSEYKKEFRNLAIAKKTEEVATKHYLNKKHGELRSALREDYNESRRKAQWHYQKDLKTIKRSDEYKALLDGRDI